MAEPVTGWQPTEASESVLSRLAHTATPLNLEAPLFPSLTQPSKPTSTSELHHHWGRVLFKLPVLELVAVQGGKA